VNANSVTFDGTGYTLASGTLTLTGSGLITANVDASITAGIAGSVGLTKSGAGVLSVDPTPTSYSGTTTINAGTLAASTGNYFGAAGSTIASMPARSVMTLLIPEEKTTSLSARPQARLMSTGVP
jgi:autotransporter-associated beta strand protein